MACNISYFYDWIVKYIGNTKVLKYVWPGASMDLSSCYGFMKKWSLTDRVYDFEVYGGTYLN